MSKKNNETASGSKKVGQMGVMSKLREKYSGKPAADNSAQETSLQILQRRYKELQGARQNSSEPPKKK